MGVVLKRILVTGSRDWDDYVAVENAIEYYIKADPANTFVLVHGSCGRGADRHADKVAGEFGLQVERHRADWSLGRRGGPIRNQQMVDMGANVCFAFIRNESRGATDCAWRAEQAGIPTFYYREDQ